MANKRNGKPGLDQQPILALVKETRRNEPALSDSPLARLEAEVMLECVAFTRAKISRLPEHSTLRQEWGDACADLALAARWMWPSACPAAAGQ